MSSGSSELPGATDSSQSSHLGHLRALTPQGEDPSLHGADPDEVEHVPARLQAWGHLGGERERLVVLTGIDEHVERALP